MKVAFDSRPASDPRGIGRYARCLLAALRDSPRGELVESREPRGCDVFHSPWIDGAPLRSPVPSVVTVHDLVPLKRPGEYLRSGLRFKLRYLAVQRATRVIVPTQTVAEDAVAALRIEPGRITTIAEAAAPVFWPRSPDEVARVRARYGLPDRYLMWVGGMLVPDPRKRVAALAKARRSMPLVLVGPAGRWARELTGVHVTGTVSDDDLAAIYTGAHALVFPSDDEGFGLPPLEALACGTPVAACDLPALREVLVDRVPLVDIGDLDGLIRTAEGLSRPAMPPPDWSWTDAAAATWDVYEQALAGSGHSGGRTPNGGIARRTGVASRRRRA
jgi:glycosyltransferase involved in cell wall biosynthesis